MAVVTLARVPVIGYGDEIRYDVKFLDHPIGQVYRITESVDVNTGPSRIGQFVNRTYWYFEIPGRQSRDTLGYRTRRDVIAALLEVNHYPGRPHQAARFARLAKVESNES